MTWSLIKIYIPLLMVPELLISCQSINNANSINPCNTVQTTVFIVSLFTYCHHFSTIFIVYEHTIIMSHCSTTLYSYCSQSGSYDDESCVQQWMEVPIFQYTILVGKNTSIMIGETIIHSQVNHLLLRIVEVTQVQIPNFHRAENIIYLNRR